MDESRPVSARVPTRSSAPVSGSAVPPSGSTAPPSALSPPVDADEAAAAKARRRYRSERMAAIWPDPVIGPLLAPGERVLAVRRSSGFERRPASEGKACSGRGDLYLTSARLVLLEQRVVEICIDQIQEAMVSGNHLLLVLHDGAGMALEVDRPLLLRVELATARAARSQAIAGVGSGLGIGTPASRAASGKTAAPRVTTPTSPPRPTS